MSDSYFDKEIDIFIINLKKDKDKLNKTINELNKCNIKTNKINKYDAINGKEIQFRYSDDIHPYCKLLCTDNMIGCGLSHIRLCRYLKEKNYDHALILEDDIKIDKCNLNIVLNNIINKFNNIDNKWDIILLFNQGYCPKENKLTAGKLCGSTAAYIISARGMDKISNIKLIYHIDWLRNTKLFKTYVGPKIFSTYDPKFNDTLLNYNIKTQNVYFWWYQHVLRIPYVNFTITLGVFIFIVILSFILLYLLRKSIFFYPYFILLAILWIWPLYSLHDTSYYRASQVTHYFGIIYPLLVLLYIFLNNKNRLLFYIILYLTVSMLFFHISYHFEKDI